jgi:hypothetical protein
VSKSDEPQPNVPSELPPPPRSPEEIKAEARKIVQDDLKVWQEKVAKAADKGADNLEQRVGNITASQIENQVHGVGKSLLVELEETVRSEIDHLKSTMKAIVMDMSDDSGEERDMATDRLLAAVRSAGLAIKDKAQAIRTWRRNYDQETDFLVRSAAESTLQIIDGIADLGLQEVGMRWAFMDGVTYEDWQKYHKMKDVFEEWRAEVELVAGLHLGLKRAHEESAELEDQGMAIAEEAAKELGRLKDVGRWKIHALDTTDDFSSRAMPVVDEIKEMSENVSGGTAESLPSQGSSILSESSVTVSSSIVGTEPVVAEKAAAEASEEIAETAQPSTASVVGDKASEFADDVTLKESDASSIASPIILGTGQPNAENLISAASEKSEEVVSSGSFTILSTQTPMHESLASETSINPRSAASAISEAVSDEPSNEQYSENVVSKASHSSEILSDSVSSLGALESSTLSTLAAPNVLGGAMAQKVEARQIIYDDVVDDGDAISG